MHQPLRAPFHAESRAHNAAANTQSQFIHEIDTRHCRDQEERNKRANRIEIVEWAASESSIDQNSGSQSVSLSNLMMGSTGSGGTNDSQLTVDNLWKILAAEKPGDEKVLAERDAKDGCKARNDRN